MMSDATKFEEKGVVGVGIRGGLVKVGEMAGATKPEKKGETGVGVRGDWERCEGGEKKNLVQNVYS